MTAIVTAHSFHLSTDLHLVHYLFTKSDMVFTDESNCSIFVCNNQVLVHPFCIIFTLLVQRQNELLQKARLQRIPSNTKSSSVNMSPQIILL